jgi:fructuronate reductase
MRLNSSTYKNIQDLKYNKKNTPTSIVHLGLGAFFKGHLAFYMNEYNNLNEDTWLIEAVSLKTNTSKKKMQKQDNLYTVHLNGLKTSSHELISSVKNSLFLDEDRKYIMNLLVSENTKLITLTITEKGYCYSPKLEGLDINNSDIKHDFEYFSQPISSIGILCFALQERKTMNLDGITIMSCDNLPSNGELLKKVILDFASQIDRSLKIWIEKNCAFPSTMVDRIVPSVTSEALNKIENTLGLRDECGVICEDYAQFVIENNFVNDIKPDLSKVGVLFVDNIQAYENMKLRILNGTHSALAYIGQLLNINTIYDAINDANIEIFINRMISNEIIPSLELVDGINLEDYSKTIIMRYHNPNIIHKTIQISMDGSLKIPQRWLETLRYLMENNKNFDCIVICLASWMKFTSGLNLESSIVKVDDPKKDLYIKIWNNETSIIDIVKAFFSISDIFDSYFTSNDKLIEKVAISLENINNLKKQIKEIK